MFLWLGNDTRPTLRRVCLYWERKMMLRAAMLKRASDLIGFDTLSTRIGAGREVLACWMLLEGVPPASVFLKAADIIFEHQLAALRRTARGR